MKLKVALGVSGLFFGAGSFAQASHVVTPASTNTYVFEAAQGSPDIFNGSTISIDIDTTGSGGILSFSLVDTALDSSPFTSGSVLNESISSATTTDWSGSALIGVAGFQTFSLSGSPDFIAENGEVVTSAPFLPFTPFGHGHKTVDMPAADPFSSGQWIYEAASVPDAAGTFSMTLGVLALMAGVRYCNRPQPVAVRVRR